MSEIEPSVLRTRGLSALRGPLEVSWDVELDISAGEVVALLGPNGAGKTSTVEGIAGLTRTRGEVELDGARIDGLAAFVRARRGLALVPEDRGLFGGLSVEDNIRLGASLPRAGDGDAAIAFVVELFPALGERLRQRAGTLSGGEQQMLAIGRAMAARPVALLIDEPTQGIAPRIYDVILSALATARDRGLAVVLVEQNVEFAARIADRYLIMSGGRIVSSGDRKDLHGGEELFAQFLAG
jgi:branched-chain amino acid transport system ATP-binding protein